MIPAPVVLGAVMANDGDIPGSNFIYSFSLIQAARPIKTADKSNDINT